MRTADQSTRQLSNVIMETTMERAYMGVASESSVLFAYVWAVGIIPLTNFLNLLFASHSHPNPNRRLRQPNRP